jgi:demethylmenaquinone methyltransferase/2-methoxy-6-polyprenyl-1,4-benzoquinol methylase
MISARPGGATGVEGSRGDEHGNGEGHEAPRISSSSVAARQDEPAHFHDHLNTILSLGREGRWRAAAVAETRLRPGDAVIDVAAGTGQLAAALADRVGPFGRVVAIDISPQVVDRGMTAAQDLVQLEFVVGDALALPFPPATFDAATICFGLRDMPDLNGCLRELRRVVRPGGRVVCLELTVARARGWGRIRRIALRCVSQLAAAVARRRAASRRLWTSLESLPDADTLADLMRSSGLSAVGYRRLGLGAVALHVGKVPAD